MCSMHFTEVEKSMGNQEQVFRGKGIHICIPKLGLKYLLDI